MKHEVKAGNWIEEDTVRHQLLAGEAWQQAEIRWTTLENGSEPCSNLSEPTLIPAGSMTVHGWSKENLKEIGKSNCDKAPLLTF